MCSTLATGRFYRLANKGIKKRLGLSVLKLPVLNISQPRIYIYIYISKERERNKNTLFVPFCLFRICLSVKFPCSLSAAGYFFGRTTAALSLRSTQWVTLSRNRVQSRAHKRLNSPCERWPCIMHWNYLHEFSGMLGSWGVSKFFSGRGRKSFSLYFWHFVFLFSFFTWLFLLIHPYICFFFIQYAMQCL